MKAKQIGLLILLVCLHVLYADNSSALSAPTGVSATDGTYPNKVHINWNLVSGASGYDVYRNTVNDSSTSSWLFYSASPTYADDEWAQESTIYYYWVKAYASGVYSGFSSPDTGYAGTLPSPAAPTGVSATDGTYSNKVRISWNAVSGSDIYDIFRYASNDPNNAYYRGQSADLYYDDAADPGVRWFYWVKARVYGVYSGFSVYDTGYAGTLPPTPAPTGVSATDGTYSNKVRISWNSVSGSDIYDIFRYPSNDSNNAYYRGQSADLYYDDATDPGVLWYYWVKARANGVYSAFSAYDTGYAGVLTGAVQAFIDPSGAISAGAKWRLDGAGSHSSGDTLTGVSVGAHTVSFTDINGYTTPSSRSVSVQTSQTAQTTGTYVPISPQTGWVQAFIEPSGAISAGAKWRLDGAGSHSSGDTVTEVSVGTHTVSFTDINGYTTPSSRSVSVQASQTAQTTGTYVPISPQTGRVQAFIEPSGAISAGAKWRLDGAGSHSSGYTVTSVSVGQHTVSFTAVAGWTTPPSETVYVYESTVAEVYGYYYAAEGEAEGEGEPDCPSIFGCTLPCEKLRSLYSGKSSDLTLLGFSAAILALWTRIRQR